MLWDVAQPRFCRGGVCVCEEETLIKSEMLTPGPDKFAFQTHPDTTQV